MIGDWVCYNKPNGYLTRVGDIRRYGDEKHGYEYAIECKRDERDPLYEKVLFQLDLFNVKILHPVLLTMGILERNGFMYHAPERGMCGVATASYYDCKGSPRIYCDGDPFSVWFEDEVNIKYVHQLQHVLRLCGLEKEIKLEG